MVGLIGKKLGMTQVFGEGGEVTPVTVIKIEDNVVLDKRTADKNGYEAIVLAVSPMKEHRANKPYAGQFKKKGLPVLKVVKEFRCEGVDWEVGSEIGVDFFDDIRYVDVRGVSKGKGYQGVMKRHGFAGGPAAHGSKFHRANGSTGQASYPSKVLKGTKMPGRMGADNVCVQNLKIVSVDKDNKCILVRGAVPGPRKGYVVVTQAKKKR
ncbi:50S ribosomal protein L3 [Spirochaetia bacterium 38H-sp]|uniref:Large ribosomal subunit protein uL3 n=1 Tax=Rarispira pelagica TaxID=3141764 RepID=A0ABU9UEY1_9SPIR